MAAAGLGYEVALTRYFSVAHYSEYGYWVISMAMAGFAVSGVALSLFKGSLQARGKLLCAWLPVAALVFAALGFYGVAFNEFNALELQHPVQWSAQLLNIGKFYLALFPFFFCIGLYVGLCFVGADADVKADISRVYAWDLGGAGLGAIGLLACMFVLPPFYLPCAILPLLAFAGILSGGRARATSWVLAALFEFLLIIHNPAKPCEYKPLAYALNTQNSQLLKSWYNPRGDYALVDAFTERLDIDLSNNAGLLGVTGPPAAYGLYLDGSRLASLPKGAYGKSDYFKAALESFPYQLKPRRALLIGTRGGYKVQEALDAGVKEITALEPDPGIFSQIKGLPLIKRQPLDFLAHTREKFDLVDVSADHSGASQDKLAFTLEALRAYQGALSEQGVISLGLSIQEFGPYALKLLESVRAVAQPEKVLAYRSAWNLRVLVFKQAPSAKLRKSLSSFCDQRSFDIVWGQLRSQVYNDLPVLGWTEGPQAEANATDALAEEAARIFKGQGAACATDFDLRPATFDRPFFYSTLRLTRLKDIFNNLSLIPREELGSLVNLAVLAQALMLAGLVFLLPFFVPRRLSLGAASFGRLALYFGSLGLGYLFFEVTLIEKITPYLQDRAFAFSLVLCSMLVFSGLGSANAHRFSRGGAFGIVALWLFLAWLGLDKLLFALWGWPFAWQCGICVAVIAPLAFALGMPFSMGLSAVVPGSAALPWAWSLNGAFSVLAPPLAYLVARDLGYEAVAGLAFLVYFLAWLSYPKTGNF
jgi:hypothetical protein